MNVAAQPVSKCFSGKTIEKDYEGCFTNTPQWQKLILELTQTAHEKALALKQLLCETGLNIITAESLTAGLMASTLIDVPGMGLHVYGGFIVYDTDAKRHWLDVDTPGVYSTTTAIQMVLGALTNSRAMVAVSVTGNAMTTPENTDKLGDVFIGVAIRGVQAVAKKARYCRTFERIKPLCQSINDIQTRGKYPALCDVTVVSRAIRLLTTIEAFDYTIETINKVKQESDDTGGLENTLGKMTSLNRDKDTKYTCCNEPSDIIRRYTNQQNSNQKSTAKCACPEATDPDATITHVIKTHTSSTFTNS